MSQISYQELYGSQEERDLFSLQARVGHQQILLGDRIAAFASHLQRARALLSGNATLIVVDYLVRHDDQLAKTVRADFARVQVMLDRLLVADSTIALPGADSFPPLANGFSLLARLVSDDLFPRVACRGNVSLPDLFRDAAELDITAPLMSEKQACRMLSRFESSAQMPPTVLAAAGLAMLRLMGRDRVRKRAGSTRSVAEMRADSATAADALERMADLARALDYHTERVDDIITRQTQVCRWMIEGTRGVGAYADRDRRQSARRGRASEAALGERARNMPVARAPAHRSAPLRGHLRAAPSIHVSQRSWRANRQVPTDASLASSHPLDDGYQAYRQLFLRRDALRAEHAWGDPATHSGRLDSTGRTERARPENLIPNPRSE